MKGRIDQPDALIFLIIVTQSRLPSCIITAWLIVLELVTTFNVAVTPIIKPVLLKLYMSLLSIPYAWRVFFISLNYVLILTEFLYFVRCEWNFLFYFIWSFGWLLIKRDTQFLPTGCGGGFWLWAVSRMSAICCISIIWGRKPRWLRSKIH